MVTKGGRRNSMISNVFLTNASDFAWSCGRVERHLDHIEHGGEKCAYVTLPLSSLYPPHCSMSQQTVGLYFCWMSTDITSQSLSTWETDFVPQKHSSKINNLLNFKDAIACYPVGSLGRSLDVALGDDLGNEFRLNWSKNFIFSFYFQRCFSLL